MNRIKKDLIDSGTELEDAIDKLSLHLDDDLVVHALDIAQRLSSSFEDARRSDTVGYLLRNSVFIMLYTREFLDRVAEFYQLKSIREGVAPLLALSETFFTHKFTHKQKD